MASILMKNWNQRIKELLSSLGDVTNKSKIKYILKKISKTVPDEFKL